MLYPKENTKRDMNSKSDKMNSNDAHRGKTREKANEVIKM